MSEASCPGCVQRDALIEALQKRVDELERLVKDLQQRLTKRKRSLVCHSEEVCRFVERLLGVTQTLRLPGRPVPDHLVEALVAHRHGLPAPQWLATN